nr:link protein - rat [Rattus norvegicus]
LHLQLPAKWDSKLLNWNSGQ